MHKHANFLLKICLSSLVFTTSLVATASATISATEAQSSITKTAQKNACAGKNPCAAKANSVGGPLAKELQGKPVVVDVFATWCPGCKNIAPTLSQLKQQYSGKVNFVVLDVTDKAKLRQTEAMARRLGLGKFLEANKSKTSTVAIVDPATGDILALYQNNSNQADYTKILETALAKK
ncbi:TlpA family protein disulfide reductase [aff. Roholtiella sp. LEGE 12411]|uniref:TlpA family protein disulfide reductase n=1 Tax=aff. Roholtiella sp. LEGE 12411 TaxID=1828822 RepID=UPI00187E3F34|nr:thioredoxin family protein [aff. Roholtiella sp. LEGE 12411]MBE9038834.1 thioredoxin family protein [aff. Roholtiella sp. LEGE 12411]